jgi:hypothetical protein
MNLVSPVSGAHAARLQRLLSAVPALGAFESFVGLGDHLHVEVRWCHGVSPAQRVADVQAAARFLGAEVRSMAGRRPRTVSHWVSVPDFDGGTVIVAATICECHDGLEATLGHFPDRGQVIATATGKALREVFPPAMHAAIGAAETVIDTELAFRDEVSR